MTAGWEASHPQPQNLFPRTADHPPTARGWIQVSAKCLVCERKFKVWVPDTPQNERDASETVMTRLKQHLWSVHEEHGLSEGQIKNIRKNAQADVQEHAGEKLLVAKIIRKRKTVAQPTDSTESSSPSPLSISQRDPKRRPTCCGIGRRTSTQAPLRSLFASGCS